MEREYRTSAVKYSSYKWVPVSLACGCLFLLAGVLSHNTSMAYASSVLQTPTARSTIASTATPETRPTATVINVSETSSFPDPSSVIAIVGLLVQIVTLGFIIKYVRDTAAMAKATRDSANATRDSAKAAENTVQEMQAAREDEYAPYVVVYFDYHDRYKTLYIVVENIGKSIARDIRFEFSPPLQATQFNKDHLEKNLLLKNGIKSLVPNYKISIPFDFLIHYLKDKLPMEYMVKVTYQGNPSPSMMEFEYPLDLNHFNYIHFVTDTGLTEIEQSLEQLANHFSHFSRSSDTTNYQLSQIANAINSGLVIKNRVSVSPYNEDIPTILKEFVYLWLVDYGKQADKWNNSCIFDLRAKAALKGEALLNCAVLLDSQAWADLLKQVIRKLSQMGSMRVNLDGPTGSFSDAHFFFGGSSKEDFDELGDSIVLDIRTVIELIEKEQTATVNDENGEEAQFPPNAVEAD